MLKINRRLGLGHSLDPDSVMRPIYKGYSWANLKLGAKDIDGVEKLYGEDPSKFKNDGIYNSRRAFEGLNRFNSFNPNKASSHYSLILQTKSYLDCLVFP